MSVDMALDIEHTDDGGDGIRLKVNGSEERIYFNLTNLKDFLGKAIDRDFKKNERRLRNDE